MRLKIAKILPLAFADTLRRICAERNDPERLSKLYLRFASILKQIREKTGLSIQRLSILSGFCEHTLEASESGRFEMTDKEFKARRCLVWLIGSDVRSVFGSSHRSAEPSATLKNQSGINGLLPSLAALGGPLHLFRLLLDLCSRFSKG